MANSMNAEDPLSAEQWQRMGTRTSFLPTGREALEKIVGQGYSNRIITAMESEESLKVMWLSTTLFFVVG